MSIYPILPFSILLYHLHLFNDPILTRVRFQQYSTYTPTSSYPPQRPLAPPTATNQWAIRTASSIFTTFNVQKIPLTFIAPRNTETGLNLAELPVKKGISVLSRCTSGTTVKRQVGRSSEIGKPLGQNICLAASPSHNGISGLLSDPRVSAFPICTDIHIANTFITPAFGPIRLEPVAVH